MKYIMVPVPVPVLLALVAASAGVLVAGALVGGGGAVAVEGLLGAPSALDAVLGCALDPLWYLITKGF